MSEKKQSSRLIINLIGIPVILAILYIGDDYHFPFFSLFVLIVQLLCVKEFPVFIKSKGGKIFMPLLYGSIILIQLFRYNLTSLDFNRYEIPPIGIGFLMAITIVAICVEIFRKENTPLLNISSLIFGVVWIGFMLGSMAILRNFESIGREIIFLMFFSIWACDSAAFFFGSKFGKKKILPLVSPKKSWVGSISGFVATMLVVYAFYFYNAFGDYLLSYHLVVLGIIYGAISQLGDFGESLLKREVKIKDSSTLLKGHGGVLDRFDSMLIAAPLTYLYLVYFV